MKVLVEVAVVLVLIGVVAIWWDKGVDTNYIDQYGLKGIVTYVWCGKAQCKE